MSFNSNNKCCLCYNNANEECQQFLYDENGQCTEIYEITVKFFDPMLLVNYVEKVNRYDFEDKFIYSNRSTVICEVCWDYIREFNDFQEGIITTQNKLTEDIQTSLTAVKEETEIKIEIAHDNSEEMDPMDLNPYCGNDNDNDFDNLPNNDNIQSTYNEDNDEKNDEVNNGLLIDEPSENQEFTTKRRTRRPKKSAVPKNCNDADDSHSKTVRYNSMKKIQELDNFISEVKPQLECDICKDNLANYNDLRQHFTEKHRTKCYILCCDRKIYRRYLLVEHLKIHVNPDTFKCDICGTSSASSRSLKSHKRFMHGNVKMIECEICHKHFKTKPILMRHMEIHNNGAKDFKCPECERCYASDYQLKAHITKIHHETICEQCGKTVHGMTALKLHIIHQHSGNKPAKIPCDQCNAKLASKKGLNAHKLSFHSDGLTAFICKVCGKIASSESALLRHKKYVHELERKYKCQYCDKAFKKSSNLKEHISIHTGQHLYQCLHCTQTFGNSANMHNHRKKAHPVEFALSRENRTVVPKVDLNSVINEVVL